MPAPKIQNEQEVIRWFEEGRSYPWMQEQYRKKYNIETSKAMWANFRRRRGLELRLERSPELIPWKVLPEHQLNYSLAMLRVEGRRRRGETLREVDATRLEAFKEQLAEGDLVVHYDPETEEGFFLVPRRENVDTDMIREPEKRTSRVWGADDTSA